jgi:hypothetical protein
MNRHKNVEFCSVGALAIHMVHRFHIEGEMKPNFEDRSSWYNIPIIRINDGAITYQTQRNYVLNTFDHFGITCRKKTHLGRDVAVSVGTKAGLSENSMKRHGNFHF